MHVDFFIAGAPKCGTTALAAYLDAHENICFSQPKEPHFFCASISPPKGRIRTVEEYHEYFFPHYDAKIHRAVGEGTPQYLYDPEAIPAILSYNPSAKFIVMLRNPVDMVFSWHREMLRGVVENVADIQAAWELQEQRARGEMLPADCRVPMHLQYRSICMLGEQVERLLSQVDRDNVLFALMSDLRNQPRETYCRVCTFLGVEDDGRDEFPDIHSGVEWRSGTLMRLYNLAYAIKRKVLGDRPLPFSMDARMKAGFMKGADKTERYPAFVRMLKDEYRQDVQKLSSLIDRDLSIWVSDA